MSGSTGFGTRIVPPTPRETLKQRGRPKLNLRPVEHIRYGHGKVLAVRKIDGSDDYMGRRALCRWHGPYSSAATTLLAHGYRATNPATVEASQRRQAHAAGRRCARAGDGGMKRFSARHAQRKSKRAQRKSRQTRTMTTKTATTPEIEVITVCDHHDERSFLDMITGFAETGTAHVRYLGSMAEGLERMFAVSNRPLSLRRALNAVRENEIECARNDLRVSKNPYEVWDCYDVSVADVDRIAKEEGISSRAIGSRLQKRNERLVAQRLLAKKLNCWGDYWGRQEST